MATPMSSLAASYVQATNQHNEAALLSLFDEQAVVDDNFREIRGLAAIREWCHREIIAAQVTLEVQGCDGDEGHCVLTTRVDGNFDRTGLPDPVIISHDLKAKSGKIIALTCRLVA